MAIQNQTVTQTFPRFQSLTYPTVTVTSTAVATASTPLTITTAQLLGGFLIIDTQDAATITLPTAALLVAAIPAPGIGTSFRFAVRNTGDSTLTVAGGTGGTISGTATLATVSTKEYIVVLTAVIPGSETYTVYALGSITT